MLRLDILFLHRFLSISSTFPRDLWTVGLIWDVPLFFLQTSATGRRSSGKQVTQAWDVVLQCRDAPISTENDALYIGTCTHVRRREPDTVRRSEVASEFA